eukprot:scaffold1192_cov58-Cylindrotheca_fusiformis.AAC.14
MSCSLIETARAVKVRSDWFIDGGESERIKHECGFTKSKIVAGQRNVRQGTTWEAERLEDTLAARMSSMSFQEREKAMDDLHCVGVGLEENEETRRRSLAELDQIVKATKNRYYDLASSQNIGFVEDESFRLKFLRAQSHDAKSAVRQMMNFLYFKATYFGEDNVAREIELSDLSTEEVAHVRSGYHFVSKDTDRAGRLVLYVLNNRLSDGFTVKTTPRTSQIRANFFLFYNLIASLPEVQMKGISAVYYDKSKPGEGFFNPGFQAQVRIMSALNSIPFRCSSLHLCIKPTQGNLILNNNVFRAILNSHLDSTLSRTRLHVGSDMEIQYTLQSHGISLSTCPVDSSGEFRQTMLNTWYEHHLERMKSTGLCVDQLVYSIPSANTARTGMESEEKRRLYSTVDVRATDVLLGRGRGFQDHPGNIRFRNALQEYRHAYDTAPKWQKRRIAVELRRMLAVDGVRFLEQVDGTKWVESDVKAVEAKIGQLFRSARKKNDALVDTDLIGKRATTVYQCHIGSKGKREYLEWRSSKGALVSWNYPCKGNFPIKLQEGFGEV